jgi:hypothetical protein
LKLNKQLKNDECESRPLREETHLQETASRKQILEVKSLRQQVSELESERQLQHHRILKHLMEWQLDDFTLVSQLQIPKLVAKTQSKELISSLN